MKCLHCGSSRTIKAGKKKNKYVTKQGYRCKDCERYFVERDGFEDMTYPKEIIVAVLHLFVEGFSLSKIREHIYQHHGYRISDGSILFMAVAHNLRTLARVRAMKEMGIFVILWIYSTNSTAVKALIV